MATFSRILCPVDFSEFSSHTLAQAAQVAAWYGASLTLQHVYVPMFVPVPGLPDPLDRVPVTEIGRAETDAAALAQTAAALAPRVDVRIDVGRAAPAILDRAASLGADLIVMGTHGSGGFERFAVGSVTERVLRRAACPVLTVPPQVQSTARLPFRRIVCAFDFSDWSMRALEAAASLAQESGSTLDLVYVVEWPWHEPPPPPFAELPPPQAAALLDFRRYLVDRATHRLNAIVSEVVRGRSPVAVRVGHGTSWVEILRVAAETSADLIVLGVHARNPLDLLFFGSTTHHVVRRATCAVLTLRQ